jgi:hypothetical protein
MNLKQMVVFPDTEMEEALFKMGPTMVPAQMGYRPYSTNVTGRFWKNLFAVQFGISWKGNNSRRVSMTWSWY